MLKPYSRDSADFQNIRDRGMTIAYKPFDMNFNNMVDYLNKKILPVINALADKKAAGIFGYEDSFLRNIGDGTTVFDFVRNSDIATNSIKLNKLAKQTKYSVIASDNTEILRSITPAAQNQALINDRTLVPRWEKLKHSHFEDASITAEKVAVGTLSARHIADGIIGAVLPNNSIIGTYIQNNTIPNQKIAKGSFTNTKINASLMNTRVPAPNLQFDNKCFTTRTIQDNSVDMFKAFFRKTYGTPYSIYANVLTHENFKDNSIEITCYDNYFFDVSKRMDNSIIPQKIQNNSLDIKKLVSTVSNTNDPSRKISKNNLSPEIKAILVNKGGLKL